MDPDLWISDAVTQPSSTVPEAEAGHSRYVEPAPLMDVMIDQLEYLVAHKSAECPPNCLACERLEQVEGWLMLPFRASVRP